MEKWQDPTLSLGERCVLFSENEMKNGVAETYPNSFTSPRIVEYFSICSRLKNGKEVPIPLKSGNWCAAAGSYALYSSLLPGETLPHGYRVGVVEVVSDLQKNGLYRTIQEVRSGKYTLKVGDVIVFDRSKPNDPSTAWFRHYGRVYSIVDQDNFQCISGNSGGKWKISNHNINQKTLLGFGEYPSLNSNKVILSSTSEDFSHLNEDELAPKIDSGMNLDSDDIFDKYNIIFNSNKIV